MKAAETAFIGNLGLAYACAVQYYTLTIMAHPKDIGKIKQETTEVGTKIYIYIYIYIDRYIDI